MLFLSGTLLYLFQNSLVLNRLKSSKNSVCGQHEEELKLLWCDKRNYLINSSVNVMESVFKVCDITLCNFTKDKRTGRVRFKGEIDSEIEELKVIATKYDYSKLPKDI